MSNPALTALQIRSLLQAIETKQTVSIQFDDCPLEANGLLLGGDFIANELLLCDTYPDISQELGHRHSRRSFWLRIKTAAQYLRVLLELKNNQHGLITAKIISVSTSSNKRWHNRVEFAPLRGPITRINQEFAANLDANLRDLSAKGAAIEIWGKELNRVLLKGQRLNLNFAFNPHFEMGVECSILSSQFIRQPSCHTRLRVHFNQLDTLSYCQLSHFVDATAIGVAA